MQHCSCMLTATLRHYEGSQSAKAATQQISCAHGDHAHDLSCVWGHPGMRGEGGDHDSHPHSYYDPA